MKCTFRKLFLLPVLSLATLGIGGAAITGLVQSRVDAATPPAVAPTAATRPAEPLLRTFLDTHCIDCHDDTTQKGNLRLDTLAGDFSSLDTSRTWIDVYDKVSSGEMPPKKKVQPPDADKAHFLARVKEQLTTADHARQLAEGRVVLRRLNRVEYENTIRELLNIDIDLKDLLPEDGSALGFDNVAAALNISSVQMAQYLETADEALDAAIQTGKRPETKTWDVPMTPVSANPEKDYRLKTGVAELPDGSFVFFNSNGETPINCDQFKATEDGRYRIRVSAYAHQSEKPLTMFIQSGGFDSKSPKRRDAGYFEVPPTPDQPRVIEFTEWLPKRGTIKILAFETGKRGVRSTVGYTGPGVAVKRVQVEGPLYESWPPPSHTRLFGDLNLETAKIEDAQPILLAFANRAFRRPVSAEEVEPYVELVRDALAAIPVPVVDPKKKPRPRAPGEQTRFETAIRVGLKAILCSPDFLFLRERPGKLDNYALASRLSYFLWSNAPDAELLARAADGTLAKPDVLRMQTERLLADKRAAAFVTNFTGQWLGLRQIDATTPDKKLYPEFDAHLQWSMVEETRRFFQEILNKDLSLTNFIDSDFSFLNGRLARHYGIAGVEGTEPQLTKLPTESHRGGLLGQGSILKITANGTTTSPVTRGAWVLRNIVGQPPRPPPPNTPAIEPDTRGATTVRQQLDKHREVASCASCHVKIDPPGNALERFDPIGGWRDTYRSLEGKSPNVSVHEYRVGYRIGPAVNPADALSDGRSFNDFDAFKKLLASEQDQLARCLAEKLIVYSTGGGLSFIDRQTLEEVVRRTRAKNYGFRTMVHEVIQSPAFLNK